LNGANQLKPDGINQIKTSGLNAKTAALIKKYSTDSQARDTIPLEKGRERPDDANCHKGTKLLKVEHNKLNSLSDLTFVSISYWKFVTGEAIGISQVGSLL